MYLNFKVHIVSGVTIKTLYQKIKKKFEKAQKSSIIELWQ